MTSDADMASLRHEELMALVQQLRQQVAERDQEIERLQRLLTSGHAPTATAAAPLAVQEPDPGSEEGLLAQLEQIYPEGR
jgi:uncharacterized protein involved in exopolysaccharide biosynthesis